MINKNLLNLLLITFSGFLAYVIILPSYNGTGYNYFNIEGAVQSYYENKNINEKLDKAKNLTENASGEASAYKDISTHYLTKLMQSIPFKKDIIRNINDLDTLATSNKLKIVSIKFTKPTDLSKNPKAHILSMNISGEYLGFINFLKKIEKSLELYSVKSLAITTDEETNLTYSLTIETYETNK